MKNSHRVRKVMGRSLIALTGLALLWHTYPVLGGILIIVTSLCAVAYWGDRSKSISPNNGVSLEEFRRQLGFTETIGPVDLRAEEEQCQEDRETRRRRLKKKERRV